MNESTAPQTGMTAWTGLTRTGFADRDAAKADQTPKYSAKKDQIDRICIIDKDALFIGYVHNHFNDDKSKPSLGYVLCDSKRTRSNGVETISEIAPCCQMLPEARKRCGTTIIKYAVDPKSGAPSRPLAFTLLLWVFSPSIYDKIDALQTEGYPLDATDLKVSCEDEKFQKITLVPARDCIRALDDFKKRHGETVQQWHQMMIKDKLPRAIGRSVTAQELLAKTGNAGSAQAGPSVAPAPPPDAIANLFDESGASDILS